MVHGALFCIFDDLFISLNCNILIIGIKCSKMKNCSFLIFIIQCLSNTNFSIMQIFMVNVIISLLHMDNTSVNLMHCGSPGSDSKLINACSSEDSSSTRSEGGNKMVISFTGLLLDILRRNIPSSMVELENTLDGGENTTSSQVLEWRMSISKRFIEEFEWRLSILQHLLPLSERQWRWKEALTVLRAAPSKLLNL